MLKILEFRAKIKALKEEGNLILGKCETEKRAMTADEISALNQSTPKWMC